MPETHFPRRTLLGSWVNRMRVEFLYGRISQHATDAPLQARRHNRDGYPDITPGKDELESVEVRFRTEGGEQTNRTELVLTGSPRVSNEKPQAEDTSTEEMQPEGTRWTVARTKEEVSPNHAPGVYNFFSVIVNTSGDLRFLLEDDEMTMGLFDRSFEVVRESDRPKIVSGKFVR